MASRRYKFQLGALSFRKEETYLDSIFDLTSNSAQICPFSLIEYVHNHFLETIKWVCLRSGIQLPMVSSERIKNMFRSLNCSSINIYPLSPPQAKRHEISKDGLGLHAHLSLFITSAYSGIAN